MVRHHNLLLTNTPWTFWRLLDEQISAEEWCEAGRQAMRCLTGLPVAGKEDHPVDTISVILGERQFGLNHRRLSYAKQIHYTVRLFFPEPIRPVLRRLFLARQRNRFFLNWPVEDCYMRVQFEGIRRLMENRGLASVPYGHFWPEGKRFALVLTHDVGSDRGQ